MKSTLIIGAIVLVLVVGSTFIRFYNFFNLIKPSESACELISLKSSPTTFVFLKCIKNIEIEDMAIDQVNILLNIGYTDSC